MATKKLKKKVQRKPAARKAENPVVESAREIWLAGLGAFSVAQEEGAKALERGNKMFDQLVKEGSKLEKKTRKDVEGAFDDIRSELETRVKDIRGEVENRAGEIRKDVETRLQPVLKQGKAVEKQADDVAKQAAQGWDKLEGFFDARVADVMSRLGIPTRDDIDSLNRRVQSLSRKVAGLEKQLVKPAAKPKAKAAPKKAPVKKPVAKKAAPKKAAVKKAAPKKAAPKKAAVKKAAPKAAAPKAA